MGFDSMKDLVTPDGTCAVFPAGENEVAGSLNPFMGIKPTTDSGVTVWLNAGADVQTVLDKVEAAGGRIVQPKTDIGEYGHMAFIIDTEGNRIGLHAMG